MHDLSMQNADLMTPKILIITIVVYDCHANQASLSAKDFEAKSSELMRITAGGEPFVVRICGEDLW